MEKYLIDRMFEPKHITGNKNGKSYDFWSMSFLNGNKLISMTGTEEELRALQVGDPVEGYLEENPYTDKNGEKKMSYRLKKPNKQNEALAEVSSQIQLLWEAHGEVEKRLAALEIVPNPLPTEPEIDPGDLPF